MSSPSLGVFFFKLPKASSNGRRFNSIPAGSDVPWTLDSTVNSIADRRVQPMWANISVNFNIIGRFGCASGDPPLATDNGGFYKKNINDECQPLL